VSIHLEHSVARGRDGKPTEDHAEKGYVGLHPVFLSQSERWVEEDGSNVIRSTEFDVFGEGATLDEAVQSFLIALFEFRQMLAGLSQEHRLTDHEAEMLAKLDERVTEVWTLIVDEEWNRPLFNVKWPWRHRQQRKGWYPGSKLGNSSQLSRA
jgi:hypothetical protein